jgi:transposase InsO family protein
MAQACADAGMRRSMGATGICWDNSGAESLWSTFKHEYYYRHTFATKAELVAAVDKWMYFYNTQRRHSVIGMLSPIAYEQTRTGWPPLPVDSTARQWWEFRSWRGGNLSRAQPTARFAELR